MSKTTNQRWRNRSNAALTLIATTGILVLIHFFVSPRYFSRYDLTESGIYSLSDVSKEAASSLEGLTIRVFISHPLPDVAIIDGKRRDMRGVGQQFKDKIDEYNAYSQNMIEVVFVQEDLVEEGRKAGLKVFGGDRGSVGGESEAAFDEYVLGATFQYKRVEEVLPLALDPGGYEYRITSILLRLKEKHEQSLVLDVADVLQKSEALQHDVERCHQAIEQLVKKVSSGEEDESSLTHLAQAEARTGDALSILDSLKQQRVEPLCRKLGQQLESSLPDLQKHRKDYVNNYLDSVQRFYKVYQEFSRMAESEDFNIRGQSLEVAPLLSQVFKQTSRVYKNLKDSPGKKRIGIVCGYGATCPFPKRGSTIPRSLWALLGPNDPTTKRNQQKIGNVEKQIRYFQGRLYVLLTEHFGFSLAEVQLDQGIPEDIDALFLIGAQKPLSKSALYRLDQFSLTGKSVVILTKPWDHHLYNLSSADASGKAQQDVTKIEPLDDGLNEWLAHHGVTPESTLVMEPSSHAALMVTKYDFQPGRPMRPLQEKPALYPLLPNLVDLTTESPLLTNTQFVTFPYAQTLRISEKGTQDITVLVQTSPEAVILQPGEVTALPLAPPLTLQRAQGTKANGPAPVAALIEGPSTSAYPSHPSPTTDTPPLSGGDVRILVLGSTLGLATPDPEEFFKKIRLQAGQGQEAIIPLIETLEKADYDRAFKNWIISSIQLNEISKENLFLFFRNILDWSVQNEALIAIRTKSYTRRPLETLDDATLNLYKFTNILGIPLVFLCMGLGHAIWRKRQRLQLANRDRGDT
jgi:ABC-type uncharacterized transport system involved in gliding motility auxiliary subunit